MPGAGREYYRLFVIMLKKTTSFKENESDPGIKGKRMFQEYGEVQKKHRGADIHNS